MLTAMLFSRNFPAAKIILNKQSERGDVKDQKIHQTGWCIQFADGMESSIESCPSTMKDEDIKEHKQEIIKIRKQWTKVVNNGVLEAYRKICDLNLTFFFFFFEA